MHDKPAHDGACYNIGVIEEARGDFELAARYYNYAWNFQPNEKYRAALQRVQARQERSRAMQAQILAAPPPGPAIVLPAAAER